MSNDPSACFSRAQAAWVWSIPMGVDISGKGHSFTAVNGITAGGLDQISAGIFSATDYARLSNPAFLALDALSLEFLLQLGTNTATCYVIRAGDATDLGFGLQLLAAGSGVVWSLRKRGTLPGRPVGGVLQVSTAAAPVSPGQLYHVVAVFANGVLNRIYSNGTELALTHTNALQTNLTVPIEAGPLTGPIPIRTTYELAIGDPSTSTPGFIGTLGRVVAYDYAIVQPQPAASYRLQADQPLVVNMGLPVAAGVANHGPVAVPHTAGSVAAGSPLLIPVATRGFDADNNALTALPPLTTPPPGTPPPDTPARGVTRIVSNQLEYTPNAGTGGVGVVHTVPQRLRDPSALESSGIVRVPVTAGSTPGGAPVNQIPPQVSGPTPLVIPATLQSTTGQWTGTPLISYSYQWRRDGAAIPNQTGTQYTTVTADADRAITCEVTARNTAAPNGVAEPSSNALAPFRPTKSGWPYPDSGLYAKLMFNGSASNQYAHGSDQFPVSEDGSNGLLFVGNDGSGWNGGSTKTGWRVLRCTGTPPSGLSGTDTNMTPGTNLNPKSMGVLAFNTDHIAVWYTYKSADANRHGDTFVALSTNSGSSAVYNNALGEEIFRYRRNEDFVACGTLQLGANYALAGGIDNDYIYVYTGIQAQQSVAGYANGTGNKDVWLTRVKWKGTNGLVANIADRTKYAIMTGYDAATKVATWGAVGNLDATKYIVYRDLNGISVYFNVFWHSAISKFVATYAHNGIGSANQGIAVAISDSPWDRNGWRMIGYVDDLDNADPREANWYLNVVAPSRWNNGSTMHFGVNTYVETASGVPGDDLIVTPVALTSTTSGAPMNQNEPQVTSNGLEPATLTSTTGQWTGTTPINYAFQWKRDGANILNQTNTQYLVTGADAGHSLSCQVTASNTAAPGGVAEISSSLGISPSAFAVVYPSPFTDTTGKTVKRPGVGGVPDFEVNTGNEFNNIGNNEIWDLRGFTGTVHENAASEGTFKPSGAPGSSMICGGKSTSSNSRYFGDKDAAPWGSCGQSPPEGSCPVGWNKKGVHGDTTTGDDASGNYASLIFKGPCSPGFRAHGFYIKRTMDAVVPGDDTQGAIVENACFLEIRDDVIQDDSQNEFTFRGCYLQGHGIFSWKPGNQSSQQAKSGKIMTVENCVIHLDRMHYMGEDTPGDSGSKRADKYFSPQNRNNTIIHPFQTPINTFAGMGAKWLHKTDQSPPVTRPGSLKIRYKMKNVLIRFDTPSVDGINEGEAFPYTTPIDGGESTYENVHVVWLGPNYGTSAGPVAWDTVMSAKTGQTKAELLAMGITIHDGGAGGTSEQAVFDYWQYHRDAWFAAHKYNATSDTFVWNRPGEAY